MSFRRRFRVVALVFALLSAVPAFAQALAPTVVTSTGYLNGTALTSHTTAAFNSTGATTLVALVSTNTPWNGSTVNITGVTDNLGNSWNVLTGPTTWVGGTFALLSGVYYTNAPATSTSHTVTATLSSAAPLVMHVFAVSGADVTGPPISSAITSPAPGGASAVVVSSPPIMVPANSLLLGWANHKTGATATASGDYILDPSQSTSFLWAESQTASASGSYTSQFQYDSAIGWQTALVGIKASTAPVTLNQRTTVDFNTPANIALLAASRTGGALTYTVVTGPTHGMLTGTAPNLTYVPNANYSGSDSFTFKANDGITDSNVATVSITVRGLGAGVLSSVGYSNPNPQTSHTTAAFNSTGATTLVAFASTNTPWNGSTVNITGVTDNLGNSWNVLTGPTTWVGGTFTLLSGVYYTNAPATSTSHTVTATLSSAAPLVMHVFAVSGTDVTGPPISSAITSPAPGGASAIVVSSPPIVVPANSLLLGWAKNETGATATAIGGYILDPSQSTSYLWAESQTASASGSYTSQFQYDSAIGWQTALVGIKASTAPVAFNQSTTIDFNTSVNIALLATSRTGGSLTYTVVTGPTHGMLTGTAPNLTYVPNANYSGSDSFTFKANDGITDSNVATVSTTVRGLGAGVLSSVGYSNPNPQTSHTTAAFNSTGATTLVAFVSSHPQWPWPGGTSVSINGLADNVGNTWTLLSGPTTWIGSTYGLVSAIYYVNSPHTGASHAVTALLSNPAPLVLHVFAVSGSSVTGPPISSAITSSAPGGTSASVASAPITVPANTLLLGWVKNETPATASTFGGYTLDPQSVSFLWAVFRDRLPLVFTSLFEYDSAIGWQTAVVGSLRSTGAAPPPPPAITSSPANPTNQTSASFSFSDTQTGVTFLCQLDTAAFTACTSPISYTGPLGQGSHAFSVEAQDSSGNQSSPTTYNWTINSPPTISTQPASTTINSGQTATLTVVAAGPPPLTYQWFLGTSGDASQPIAGAAAANYTTPALTATMSYWVRVSNGAGSADSSTATVTVNPAATTTTLTASPNPSIFGQTVTLKATVTAGASGSVNFLDGTTSLGTATLSGGTATLTTSQLIVGSHTLTAAYAGNGGFAPSTSLGTTQVVNLISTTTTLTSTPNPSVTGQTVTLSSTVTVVAPGTGTVTGTVTFNDGSTVLGTANLSGGSASLAVVTLVGGSHSLTATYTASGNFAGSNSAAVTQTVNAASTRTTLSSSANPSAFGQPISLTATVSPVAPGAGTVGGTVTFKDGTTVLGTGNLTSGSASLLVATLAVGSHSLTAVYAATASYGGSTSAAVTQTVKQSATSTSVSVSPLTSVSGQPVTAVVTVSPVAPGAGIPSGTVSVLNGSTVLLTSSLSNGQVSTVMSTIPVGSYTLTLSYGGDTNFTASVSPPFTVVVNQASTTTTLTASPNPSVAGQSVSLTAAVAVTSPGTGTAAGSVTFKDGTTTLGTVTLTNGTAVLSTSSLALGSHSLTASYGGSTELKASTSPAATQTVNQISTKTLLSVSPNPSTLKQSVTLTATVSAVAPGTGTPTGTITFKDGTTTLGTAALANGTAALAVSSLSLGSHSLTAAYAGATNFLASTSTAVTQTVNNASTTTALTATPNPSVSSQVVTLKATVSVIAPGTGTPTGTVTFQDGTTSLGSATLSGGTASLTTSALSLGTHSLTAVYGGASGFSGSTSTAVTQTVNPPSTTTVLTSNLNPSIYSQSVTLKAVVSVVAPGTGTPTGSVSFKDGSTVIGSATLSGGAAIINISTLTGGNHSLTAVFTDGTNFAGSTSAVVTQTVSPAPTTTVLSISPTPSVYGQPVTLKASISSGAGSSMTGAVTFKDGTSTLGTANVSGGIASLTVATLSPALHVLTAVYAGDSNFAGSTSSAGSSRVSQASTTTSVVPSVNPSVFGQTVKLAATVSPVAPGSGTPTGSVSFLDGTTTIGSATLSGGTASLSVSSLAVGSHSITAVYNGDSNFNASTSTAVTQVVNRASTSTALTASPNPSNFGQTVTLRATVSAVSPGGGTPTGSVVFKDGSTTLATVSLSSGIATLSTTGLARGSHTITAAYQQSSSYAASTSTAVTQTVQ